MSLSKEAIKKQVEFYFSDENYRFDTFLKETCELDNGFIPISTICKFKKLSAANVTVEQVKDACKDSKVVLIEDEKIKKIITESYHNYLKKDVDELIVGIKGFDTSLSLEEITSFLEEYTTPKLVRMRRDKKKKFNGEVLVHLPSKEEVEKMLGMKIKHELKTEEAKKVKKEDSFLQIMNKNDLINLSKTLNKEKKVDEDDKFDNLTDKLYKYSCNEVLQIRDIKKIVEGCAFVDIKAKCLRFKEPKDFDEKEFTSENKSVVLKKMNDEEVKKYVKEIQVIKKEKKNKK